MNHQCILLNGRNNEAEWHLVSGRKSVKLHVSGPVASAGFPGVSAFTYGARHRSVAIDLLRRGNQETNLVRILPDWSSPEIFVHVVYPTRRFHAVETASFPRGAEGLEEPVVASAALTAIGPNRHRAPARLTSAFG